MASLTFLASSALAQDPTPLGGENIVDVAESLQTASRGSIITWAASLAEYFLILVGVIAVVMIIYGGFLYITAGAVEENLKKANKTILYGVIGVIVAILAYAIVSFAASFLTPV